ncbi:hypothetical protein D9M73_226840 [compost metagenome]
MLLRRKRLAAPFPVQPGLAGDFMALAVMLDLATDLVERLAVIPGCLALTGFHAVAVFAVQHQGPFAA